jgi:hypothetical protein
MTEPYKSLETRIRERQLQTVRERMEAAALKHGKVTAKEVEEPAPITEEVEPVEELKKTTLGSYIQKAAKVLPAKEMELDNVLNHDLQQTHGIAPKKDRAKVMKDIDKRERDISGHHKGIERAVSRLTKEEVEPVDEISKEKLGRYVKAAATDLYDRGRDRMLMGITDKASREEMRKHSAKTRRRESAVSQAVDKLTYEPMRKEEVEPVEEVIQQNAMQMKIAAQRQQEAKQKQQIKLQIDKQKAAKQEQIMKQKGQQELSKIKEGELEERFLIHPAPNNFGRANRFSRLHQQAYQRLASQGQLGRAELHRKRMIEWKRRAYMAHDNPEKLQR